MKIETPATISEAIQLLDEQLSKEEKNQILHAIDIESHAFSHFNLGLWIRNNWIFGQKSVLATKLTEEDSVLASPDDISKMLITIYVKHLKGLKLEAQNELKKLFWMHEYDDSYYDKYL